jgi:hypothetical protein
MALSDRRKSYSVKIHQHPQSPAVPVYAVLDSPSMNSPLIFVSTEPEAMRFFHTLAQSVCALAGLPDPPPPGGLVIPFKPKT